MPIAAVITATLIFTVSFSVFSSSLISHPSVPPIVPLSSSTSDNQLWKFTPNGSVYAQPVVAGNYIYVQSYNRNSGLHYVYCLNSSNGIEIWNHTTDSAAIMDGKYVYVKSTLEQDSTLTASNIVYALDAVTGLQVWNYTSKDGMTPRVAMNGIVYFSTGDISEGFFVYALDASTGAELWNYKLSEYVQSIDVANGYAYISFTNVTLHGDMTGYIDALNALTGAKIWNYTIQGDAVNTVDIDRLLYVGTSGSNVYVLDPSNGQKIGNFTTEAFGAVPFAYGNLVYARVGNTLYALDSSTLTQKWSLTFQDSVGTIVPDNPNIYFSAGKTVYCLDASSGAQKWAFENKQYSIYTIAGSRAYIASFYSTNLSSPFLAPSIYNSVYELDALSGERLWNYTVQGNIMSLSVVGNIVYVGTAFATTESQASEGNGALYALKTTEISSTQPTSTFPFSIWLTAFVVVCVVAISVVLSIIWYKKRRFQ